MREEGLGSREPPESLGRGAASAPHRKTYLSKEIPGKFPGTKLQAGNDFRKHPYHLPEIYVKPKLVLQVVGRVDGDRRTPDPTPPLENRRSVADSRVVSPDDGLRRRGLEDVAVVDAARAYGARLAYRGSARLVTWCASRTKL